MLWSRPEAAKQAKPVVEHAKQADEHWKSWQATCSHIQPEEYDMVRQATEDSEKGKRPEKG